MVCLSSDIALSFLEPTHRRSSDGSLHKHLPVCRFPTRSMFRMQRLQILPQLAMSSTAGRCDCRNEVALLAVTGSCCLAAVMCPVRLPDLSKMHLNPFQLAEHNTRFEENALHILQYLLARGLTYTERDYGSQRTSICQSGCDNRREPSSLGLITHVEAPVWRHYARIGHDTPEHGTKGIESAMTRSQRP